MNRQAWLCREIDSWRQEGLVSGETAERLLQRYRRETSQLGVGAVFVGAFGALLIGLGIIALFAANWAFLGRGTRAAILIAPIIVSAALALVGTRKGWRSAAFWEPLGIFWSVVTCAAASLIAQTYQVSGSVPGFIALVALMTLPITWLTRSAAITALWPAWSVTWLIAYLEGHYSRSSLDVALAAFGMMALSLPGYITYLRSHPPRAALVLTQFVTGLVYIVGSSIIAITCCHSSYFNTSEIWTIWFFAALIAAVGAYWRLPVWPKLGLLVFVISSFVTPFDLGHFGLLCFFAMAVAVFVTAFGIMTRRLAYANIGAVQLLWIILVLFFMSRAPFVAKGLVLILAGIGLTIMNVVLARLGKHKEARQ